MILWWTGDQGLVRDDRWTDPRRSQDENRFPRPEDVLPVLFTRTVVGS